MKGSDSRLFIFGVGYAAGRFASTLGRGFAAVSGTTRSAASAAELQAAGIAPLVFDGMGRSDRVATALRAATHLLVSIPPGEAGDPVLRHHAADIAAAPRLASIVYLSTVGVYGDHGGGWVDEDTTPRPVSRRSALRLEAEQSWRELASPAGVPLAILRLAGIYGPGRNALVNLREGTARRLVKPGQVFNRIHVDDIATAIEAAFAHRAAGIFNVADDEPAPPQDVVAFAAGLLEIEPPPEASFDTAELSPMARSFYGENKRVANRRLKEALGVMLRHPSYREGLAQLAAHEV